jgi:hypothetical protein
MPGGPIAQGPAMRGKTMPLSAIANPLQIASVPAAAPAPSPVFAAAARLSPVPTPHPLAPGQRVWVQWANGQKYAGVMEQSSGAQCLVRFDGGEQRWVESRYVIPG